MGWRTVVVTQHAKVSLMTGNLVIQTDTERYHVPVSDVGVLLMQTMQAVITTAAIVALAEVQATIIFTGRDGQLSCTTSGNYANAQSAELIRKQVDWRAQRVAQLWMRVVASKLQNQIQVAQFMNHDTEQLQQELDQLELNDVTNREAVVARRYFPLIFGSDFSRSDFSPVNAALNYGYGIILSSIDQAIGVYGYQTCLGIHHARTDNAYNLGSDLMEPFRPLVDQWVARQHIRDFTPDVKYGLVDLLNVNLKFNGQQTILRNAIPKHVGNCLHYLGEETNQIKIEVEIPNEVSSYAINGHV